MPAPSSIEAFLEVVQKSNVVEKQRLDDHVQQQRAAGTLPTAPRTLATQMVRDGLLTPFQAEQFLQGRWRGFLINNKYKLLEHLGSGGMGAVYLCEHTALHRRVALKVLPADKVNDQAALDRFYREARAVAALDHPNIVRAHDIDCDGKQHFIVLEFVDGSSLHHLVRKAGPLPIRRAANYVAQAALGLQHAHEQGLVHRDIKPGNLLVDRSGTVKVLDMGLARFFHDAHDNLTRNNDEGVLGTVDYLAPEQAVDSHVDIRADIYSLGMTFYFLLSASNPFGEGTSGQKIIWHQVRQPKPIRSVRPDVPEEMAAVLNKMIDKDPAARYQTPYEVVEALAPWNTEPIPPPAEDEMPRLCLAVQAAGAGENKPAATRVGAGRTGNLSPGKAPWVISVAPPSPAPGPAKTGQPRPAVDGEKTQIAVPVARDPKKGDAETGKGPEKRTAPLEAKGPVSPSGSARDAQTKTSAGADTPRSNAGIRRRAKANRPSDVVLMAEVTDPAPSARQTQAMPASAVPRPSSGPRRPAPWLLWTVATLVVMIATAGAGTGIWLALRKPDLPPPDNGPANADKRARKKPPSKDQAAKPQDPRVSISKAKDGHHITAADYQAVVAPDGCLTALKVNGVNLLWTGGKTSRGGYLYQGSGALNLQRVIQLNATTVEAKNPAGSLRYGFAADSITIDAKNTSNNPLNFFIVFDTSVTAAMNKAGEVVKAPTTQPWDQVTWFAGRTKIASSGSTSVWGPWEMDHQVWDAALKAGESRKVLLQVGATTGAEAARVASVTGEKPAIEPDLVMQSPLNYQVFQRYSRLRGQIALKGRVKPPCDKVQARVTGNSLEGKLLDKWHPVAMNEADRTFDTTLPLAAGGWYRVEVQALRKDQVVAQAVIDKVGIGEVFVGAGQSNSTNCSEELLKTTTGMVASFSGSHWQQGNDPQPGVHDRTGGGSYWPAFGEALYAKYKVPIGIASTGHSGSSVNQWQPGGEFYKWMMPRIRQLGSGGFRAVLWHQGESDVSMTSDEYARKLTTVIKASVKDAGWQFPWFVARVSYLNPTQASFPSTRDAQKKLWDNKVALEGPDTDTLTGDNRDSGGKGIHFSGKGQRAHGKLWADKVSVYIDQVLGK
jgi:serine/threonine protein kinase